MKTKLYIYSQSNHLLFRTAIEAEILFAVCLSKKQALTGGKSLACEDKGSKKIGAESAVLNFVFFVMLKNKIEQSAAQSCLRPFELRVLPFGKTSGAKLLNFVSCPLSEVFPLTVGSGKTMAFENRPMKKVRPCTFFISEFCLGKTLEVITTALLRRGEKKLTAGVSLIR